MGKKKLLSGLGAVSKSQKGRGSVSFTKDTAATSKRLTPINNYAKASFVDMDAIQGQSFKDWEDEKLLSKFNEAIKDLTSKPLLQQFISDSTKTRYGMWPPNSRVKCPKWLDESLDWCSIRIGNKQRIIGYLLEDTFYLVFLDKEHHFWISEKKHT